MDKYERYILQFCFLRLLGVHTSQRARRGPEPLMEWARENIRHLLGRDCPDIVDGCTVISASELLAHLRPPARKPAPSALEKRLRWLGDTLKLTPVDREILGLTVRLAMHKPLQELCEAGFSNQVASDELCPARISALTGRQQWNIRERLKPTSPLLLQRLLEDRGGGDIAASELVRRIVQIPTTRPDKLREFLIGTPATAELAWDDFAHLGDEREPVEALLRAALESGKPGVNILFYGDAGTGKTAFAKTLAERLGAAAIFVGEVDEDGREPGRYERIAAFAVTRALAGRAGRTILVVDEAEDIFCGVDEANAGSRRGSKVFMNRLVESTEAPTIWITNHPELLGSAVVRRMSTAMRFPTPSRTVRRRMLQRMLDRHGVAFGDEDIERLAGLDAPPAILDTAIRTASVAGCEPAAAERAATALMRVMNDRACATVSVPPVLDFDPALSSADTDLMALADRVAQSDYRALSFCLSGPSGTGKSAYARYLAHRIGLDVVEKTGGDLLSMWVGGTEQAIAAAFAEARDRDAMLIVDEVEGLLASRAGADHRWEMTQVNEFLTQMERHPLPFVFTTNIAEALDPASLRRFLFKIRFMAMTPDQAAEAFRRSFGQEPPAGLAQLEGLTPGDFTVVARKARILGERDPARLLGWLVEEVSARPGAARAPIGFRQ